MRIINKKYLVIIIFIGVILIGVIIFKPKENVKLDNVILRHEVNNKTMAMYVGRDNNYEEYNGNTFPKGYRLNTLRSKCIDNNGEEIKDALKEEGGNITLTTNKSSYCYLYFDEKENISNICNGSTMEECINNNKESITTIANLNENQAGLYRYQGNKDIVDNNYICFGTSDKDICVNDPDHYMYRILGITKDGGLKLLKNTSVKEGDTTIFRWKNSISAKIIWGESDLFKRLNGIHESISNIFIGNNEYPYLKEETWLNKIEDSDWYQGFTRGGIVSGYTAYQVYQMENGELDTSYNDLIDGIQKSVTERYTILENAKIGLMNMTDFNYALQKDGYNCYLIGSECSQNWIDNVETVNKEFIITTYGYYDDGYHLITINYKFSNGDGYIMDNNASSVGLARPVFYLKNSINITGLGTPDNPYIVA